jgi:nicotinate-nucleotide adenylyltransferase
MRIAFFGGSFDPPHLGHIAIAHAAMARLPLDRVLVAPAATQPLKNHESQTPYAERLAMVRLAVQGDPRLEACLLDGPRPDGRPNYTLDTLIDVEATLEPDDQLFCLIGADALSNLRHWHRAAELLVFCDFIVASRPGFSLEQIASFLPDGVVARETRLEPGAPPPSMSKGTVSRSATRTDQGLDLSQIRLTGPGGHESTLFMLSGLEEDISATEIRAALHDGAETKRLLAPDVAQFIREHGLYR